MLLKPWSYTVNPIVAATATSYSNTQRISHYHLNELFTAKANDPAFESLYNSYFLTSEAFDTALTDMLAQGSTRAGSVEALTLLFDDATERVNRWDAMVQAVYPKGSKQYKVIFPKGHKPYTTGSQESIINTVKTLFLTVSGDAALSTVKTEADTYFQALRDAFNHKSDDKNKTVSLSAACDAARTEVCEQQFANLGTLTAKYFKTPAAIGTFFDLANIRNHQQTDFTHLVKALKILNIAKRTLTAGSQIRINNNGPVPLHFYSAAAKGDAAGTVFIIAAPGSNHIYDTAALGDIANNHFITVYNPDAVQTGSFVLNLL